MRKIFLGNQYILTKNIVGTLLPYRVPGLVIDSQHQIDE